MNLLQRKLNRAEWNSVELPVSMEEKEIINMINKGYHNLNYSYNPTKTIMNLLKIEHSEVNEKYIYAYYLQDKITNLINKFNLTYENNINIDKKKLQKKNIMRIENNSKEILKKDETSIYEFQLLVFINKILKYKMQNNYKWCVHYYTVSRIINFNIYNVNNYCIEFAKYILDKYRNEIEVMAVIAKGKEYIECNEYLLKYAPNKLYSHQRDIFSLFKYDDDTKKQIQNININEIPQINKVIDEMIEEKNYIMEQLTICELEEKEELELELENINQLINNEKMELNQLQEQISILSKSKLVLYTAPTATGKTLTPIALSNEYRVIFVCAARHVGVALARSAISVGKKIAFAFGCDTADDIRLHYFAAKTYERHRKTGGIYKVDNSDGENVEIMICDIKSYLSAMYYMTSFNSKLNQTNNDIILFWDEPTITLDYNNHECHNIISRNWNENIIPNIVLSSATLPNENEIHNTIISFRNKFPHNPQVYSIVSSECKKSIQVIDSNGKVQLPHLYFQNFNKLKESVKFCLSKKTLYRYFDLHEICRFISFVHEDSNINIINDLNVNVYFATIEDITMESIKEYYLRLLDSFTNENEWKYIYEKFNIMDTTCLPVNEKYPSNGMNITTSDAFTLTDGPTIFIAEDVEKIAKFCIQQIKIPEVVMNQINIDIAFNNKINQEIIKIDKMLEDNIQKDIKPENEKKLSKINDKESPIIKDLRNKINDLNNLYKNINLDSNYVVNSLSHLNKWYKSDNSTAFTSKIVEQDVQRIMQLANIKDIWKVLLLIGIGLFSKDQPIEYTEIVKEFADSQKLYLIIANGDYIYGTNYQFCHSYIGKDLENITQEKIIQAMGRVGRNKLQQSYSVRFRNNSIFDKLFINEENKIEVTNMNKLFS